MPEYPVVDTHTHTYPTPEVGRQDRGYDGPDGTIPELLADMRDAGFVTAAMLNFTPSGDMREVGMQRAMIHASPAELGRIGAELQATLVARIRRRNAWTCAVAREHSQLVPFTGLDPMMGEQGMLEELETCVRDGARGPSSICRRAALLPRQRHPCGHVYSRAQDLGLPVVFHSGWFPGRPQHSAYGRPSLFVEALRRYPWLTSC